MMSTENQSSRCTPGFWGNSCEKTCPIQCQNGGYCEPIEPELHGGVSIETDFRCDCGDGFSGVLCENVAAAGSGDGGEKTPTAAESGSNKPNARAMIAVSIPVSATVLLLVTWCGYRRFRRFRGKNDATKERHIDENTDNVVEDEEGKGKDEMEKELPVPADEHSIT